MRSLMVSLIAVAVVTVGLAACNDDDPQTNRELLVNKEWKAISGTVDPSFPTGSGGFTNNYFNLIPDCSKDDFEIYEEDGDYILDEGGTKCSTNDPQTIQGSWLLNSDETVITVSGNGASISVDIVEISENKMTLEFQQDVNNTIFTVTAEYERR
ncbi:MAG: lipocalin family protein [Catalinimonas sp.]